MISFPNCKINIGLHVVRRREDGYHDLETIFVPVPLCDELEMEIAESFNFEQDGIDIACNNEDNLVVRTYRLMQKTYKERIKPVSIHLRKNIPFGAGLGGGSSDAAFTIKMLNGLFDLNLTTETMERLASKLGADCAFFINNETAFATGIGDCLTKVGFNPLKGHKLIMVKPDETVSTAEAYSGIVPRERKAKGICDLTEAIKKPVCEWKNIIVNDFEETVFKKHPSLATIKESLYSHGAIYAAMSGSGSTVFGIIDDNNNENFHLDIDVNYKVYTFNF